jgi:hypothetical protein
MDAATIKLHARILAIEYFLAEAFRMIYGLARLSQEEIDASHRTTSRHMHRSKRHRYSITSSVRASRDTGISRPSAAAALRLMTNSNLVANCTGSSAGFSPLRIRST